MREWDSCYTCVVTVVAKYVMDQCTETDHTAAKTIKATFDYAHIDYDEKINCLERLTECG